MKLDLEVIEKAKPKIKKKKIQKSQQVDNTMLNENN